MNEIEDKKIEELKALPKREILKELAGGNNSAIKKGLIFIIFFVIALLITGLIKTMASQQKITGLNVDNELRDTLLREKEKNTTLINEIKETEERLSALRENITKNNSISENKRQQIDINNKLLGLSEVSGKGIQLVLKDGDAKKGIDANQTIVHDIDILEVINILRNAGAEAISINGHRIIASTPITCVGTVIKINDEKIGGPYIISAIGNQDTLESALNLPGGIISILEQFGIQVSKEKKDDIKIPKYNGVYKYQYIKKSGV